MKIVSGLRVVGVSVASVSLVVSCSGSSGQDGAAGQLASPSSASSSTASAPTSVHSDWPEVTFDGCRDIPDEALRSTGLDVSTKDPSGSRTSTATYLNCSLLSEPVGSGGVNILAMNRTFDSYLEKEAGGDLREYELDGRRAVALRNPGTVANCFLTVETSFGFVTLTRRLSGSTAPREQWCDGIDDMMRVYLQYLPEGA